MYILCLSLFLIYKVLFSICVGRYIQIELSELKEKLCEIYKKKDANKCHVILHI